MSPGIIETVVVTKLYNTNGRLHGFAKTLTGEMVYIPSRFCRQGIKVGDCLYAELLPNNRTEMRKDFPPPTYTIWRIERRFEHRNKKDGSNMKVLDRSNVVERTPGIRSQSWI